MQELENKFLDYQSWKETNEKLLTFLINHNSYIISRFKYVIAVVDYLFDKAVNEKHEFDKDEEEIYEVGFQYIYYRFMTINDILKHVYNDDINALESHSKSINLLLYIQDFEDELDSYDEEHKDAHERFASLEDEVMQIIEHGGDVEDGHFALLDDISVDVFEGLGIEYYGVPDIFYDIAIELNLVNDSDDDELDIDDILNGNA